MRACALLVMALLSCNEDPDARVTTVGGGPLPCNLDPYACAAGTTCWMVEGGFECLPSGASMPGGACIGSLGMPTCGDGLVCYHLQGTTEGVCAPYCDAAHGCESGACTTLVFGPPVNAETTACEPPAGAP